MMEREMKCLMKMKVCGMIEHGMKDGATRLGDEQQGSEAHQIPTCIPLMFVEKSFRIDRYYRMDSFIQRLIIVPCLLLL